MKQLTTIVITSIVAILTGIKPAYSLPFNDLEIEGRYMPYEFNMDDGGVPHFPVYTIVTNNRQAYCLTATYKDAGRVFVVDRVFLLPYTHNPGWQGVGRAVCRSEETRELTSQQLGEEFHDFFQQQYNQVMGW